MGYHSILTFLSVNTTSPVCFPANFGIFHNFLLLFTLSQKSVTRGPPDLLSSRVMFIFPISSHKYTLTLYTPGHLEITWELFAKKSADILSFHKSFITISTTYITLNNQMIQFRTKRSLQKYRLIVVNMLLNLMPYPIQNCMIFPILGKNRIFSLYDLFWFFI